MDVRQLRYFTRVIELKSFSRAAEALHVAQPALGMQIRKLEDELQTQLLLRHSRGVEPTLAGKRLWQRANEILLRVEETKQEIRELAGPPTPVVRVATSPATHPLIPVELIQRSAADLPDVQIVIQQAATTMLLDWVRTERVDLALLHLGEERPADVLVEDLAPEPALFVTAATARELPPTIGLAEVCGHSLVLPGHPHHLRALLQKRAEREGLELAVAYEISVLGTITELVERGIASAVLPASAVARHLEQGRLIARRIVDPELFVTLSLARSPRRALSKAHIQVRALLAELAAGHGSSDLR